MNTIPNCLVVHPSGDTPPHSEDQLPIKCYLQQPQHLPAPLVVRQVGSPMRPVKVNIAPLARFEAIVDRNCAHPWVPVAVHALTRTPSHVPRRLVPNHLPKNGRTDRTLDPVLVPLHRIEAPLVQQMRTLQTNNVLLTIPLQFLRIVLNIFVLKLTDRALVMRRRLVSETELEQREVRQGDVSVDLLVSSDFLFLEEGEQVFYARVERVVLLHFVGLVQFDGVDALVEG